MKTISIRRCWSADVNGEYLYNLKSSINHFNQTTYSYVPKLLSFLSNHSGAKNKEL